MTYKLLDEFEGLFSGKLYRHRVSTHGDTVAGFLFEDLYDLGRSARFVSGVDSGDHVLNTTNKPTGKKARRGDGTFGERVPNIAAVPNPGRIVSVGPIATIEIGVEVKILAKAMIKQIDRVYGDLEKQSRYFRSSTRNSICIGVVGINQAPHYTSVEGRATWTTNGSGGYKHPIQEAADAESRVVQHAGPHFDELLILRFIATNEPPFRFRWVDKTATETEYAAALVRISREFQARF